MLGWHLVAMGEPLVLVMLAAAVLLAWRWPVRARSFAAAALVLLSVLLTVKKMTQDRARARYAESVVQETPRALAITPSPASGNSQRDRAARGSGPRPLVLARRGGRGFELVMRGSGLRRVGPTGW